MDQELKILRWWPNVGFNNSVTVGFYTDDNIMEAAVDHLKEEFPNFDTSDEAFDTITMKLNDVSLSHLKVNSVIT